MEKYFIPHNFKDNGRILGVWEKKHFYLALAWWIPTTLGLFLPTKPEKTFVREQLSNAAREVGQHPHTECRPRGEDGR